MNSFNEFNKGCSLYKNKIELLNRLESSVFFEIKKPNLDVLKLQNFRSELELLKNELKTQADICNYAYQQYKSDYEHDNKISGELSSLLETATSIINLIDQKLIDKN